MAHTLTPKDRLHINNNSRPVIFLGSGMVMEEYSEICEYNNIPVHGIIDSDYYGNTDELCGIPVIDTEESFNDLAKVQYYQDNFNFFIARTWTPIADDMNIRNRKKRKKYIDIIEKNNLYCISLVDPMSSVSKYSTIGRGVFIDAFVSIEPNSTIGDYTSIYSHAAIGHDTIIGRNCVFQRRASVSGVCKIEDDVFFGIAVKQFKSRVTFGSGTFIHEGVCIKRGTVPNEIVSFQGGNQKRIYNLDEQE